MTSVNLASASAYDTVIFALVCALLLATSIALLRDARRHQVWSRLCRASALAARELRSWNKADHDEVNRLVQARLQELRVEHFRWGCRCLCILVAPNTILLASNITFGLARIYTPVQDVLHITFHCVLVWVIYRPSDVSWRTIDAFYGVSVAIAAVYISPWAIGQTLNPTHVASPALGAIVFCMARRSLPINMAASGLVATTTFCTISNPRYSVSNPPMVMSILVSFQICFAIGAQVLDTTLRDTIRQGMEMREAQELIQAASAMLRSCCDAMVELDSEGVILSHGRDLANLLLRGSGYSFHNTRLADAMVDEEDRQKFSRKLFSTTLGGNEMAEAIHVHMRDGNNDTIRTQVLWFRFRRVDGQPRYMVGIREFSDAAAVGTLSRPVRAEPSGDAGKDSDSDVDVSLGTLDASSVDGVMAPGEEQAVLTVDIVDPDLLVQACSQGFCMRVGRLAPGASLLRRIHHESDFLEALQTAANMAAAGGDSPHFRVTLNMRQGQVKATCRILLETDPQTGEPVDLDLGSIRILFSEIEQRGGRGMRRHDRHDAAAPSARGQLRGTPVGHMTL